MTDRRLLAGLLVALACAGCGPAPPMPPGASNASRANLLPARVTLGEIEATASVVPLTALNSAMARRYGVTPGRSGTLLVVGLQAGETPRHASVSGHARDLRGVRQGLVFREIEVDGEVEYIAAVAVTPPDTLRFELEIDAGHGHRGSLKFSHDLLP